MWSMGHISRVMSSKQAVAKSFRHTYEGDAAFSEVPGGRPPSFSRLIRGGKPQVPLAGQCGGGKNPPQISRRKGQAGSLGTKEKAASP